MAKSPNFGNAGNDYKKYSDAKTSIIFSQGLSQTAEDFHQPFDAQK